jgi:hypothetical protein
MAFLPQADSDGGLVLAMAVGQKAALGTWLLVFG